MQKFIIYSGDSFDEHVNVKQKPSNNVPVNNQKSAKISSDKSSKSPTDEATARLSPEDSKGARKSAASKNEVASESESSSSSDEEIDIEDLLARKAAVAAITKVNNTSTANQPLGNDNVKNEDKAKVISNLSDDSSDDDDDDEDNEQLLLQKMKALHESPEKDLSESEEVGGMPSLFDLKSADTKNLGMLFSKQRKYFW